MTTSALNTDPEPPGIAPLPYVALLTEIRRPPWSSRRCAEWENYKSRDIEGQCAGGYFILFGHPKLDRAPGQECQGQQRRYTEDKQGNAGLGNWNTNRTAKIPESQPQPKNPPDDEDSPRPMKQDGVASPAKRPPSQMLISECTSYRCMDFVPAKPTRQLRAMVSERAELVSTRNQIVEALDSKKIVLILAEHKRLEFLKRGRRKATRTRWLACILPLPVFTMLTSISLSFGKKGKEVIVTTPCRTPADEFPSSLINIISANSISFDKSTGWSSSEIMPIELLIEYVFTPHVACRLISIGMEVSDSEAEDIRTESNDFGEAIH
ncbi:hypothetical protein B0H14DRAFT_2592475 [Mycena olivaceomarginata]|nr:hypothetical protein B0H14DRAFT_2592475 [Mycena olivaceomarginata]